MVTATRLGKLRTNKQQWVSLLNETKAEKIKGYAWVSECY